MRIGVIRVDLDGSEHLFLRRFLPALLARSNAEIIVRRRALGIDRERFR